MGATMPRFVEMERRYGSVIRGLRAAVRAHGPSATAHPAQARRNQRRAMEPVRAFKDGIGTMVDALASQLGRCSALCAEVVALTRRRTSARRHKGGRDGGSNFAMAQYRSRRDCVRAAGFSRAPLLESTNAQLAASCAQSDTPRPRPSTSPFAPRFSAPPDVSASWFRCRASAHHRGQLFEPEVRRPRTSRNDPGAGVLGGAMQSEMLALNDEEMVAAARKEFARLLGVTAEPVGRGSADGPTRCRNTRSGIWRVAEIERAAAASRVRTGGCGPARRRYSRLYASGERAAQAVLSELGAVPATARAAIPGPTPGVPRSNTMNPRSAPSRRDRARRGRGRRPRPRTSRAGIMSPTAAARIAEARSTGRRPTRSASAAQTGVASAMNTMATHSISSRVALAMPSDRTA